MAEFNTTNTIIRVCIESVKAGRIGTCEQKSAIAVLELVDLPVGLTKLVEPDKHSSARRGDWRRDVADRQPVRSGRELLGWVRLTGQDGYWTLGAFEPAVGFEPYQSLFERERELSERLDGVPEADYCSASDAWHAALERINELGLSVGEPGLPARDFKFTGAGEVEFKWGL